MQTMFQVKCVPTRGADVMENAKPSRRDVLKASTGLAAATLFAQPLRAAAPAPSEVTPSLIAAARKEGRIAFYTALELPTAERLGQAFQATHPGIALRVERPGARAVVPR